MKESRQASLFEEIMKEWNTDRSSENHLCICCQLDRELGAVGVKGSYKNRKGRIRKLARGGDCGG